MIDRRNWWARGVDLNAGPVYRSPPKPHVLHWIRVEPIGKGWKINGNHIQEEELKLNENLCATELTRLKEL